MNGKTKIIILICSLILNVTLITMILYRASLQPPPPKPLRERREQSEQHRIMRERINENHSELIRAKRAFFSELSSPQINETRLKELLEEIVTKQLVLENAIGSNLIDLRTNMTPEEAQAFFQNLGRRINKPHHRHRRK